MKSVFHCSPTNSQPFTSCCETAICEDQAYCPICKAEVYPGYADQDGKPYPNYIRHQRRFDQAFGSKRMPK